MSGGLARLGLINLTQACYLGVECEPCHQQPPWRKTHTFHQSDSNVTLLLFFFFFRFLALFIAFHFFQAQRGKRKKATRGSNLKRINFAHDHFGDHWTSTHITTWNCYQHIETETKWPPFCSRQHKMHFLVWKLFHFYSNFTEMCSQGPN